MSGDSLSRIDFPDRKYTLKQRAVRNAYKLYDSQDNEVLSAKQKLFKMKEEFPFKDPEGREVFSVKAEQVMDIAGDYAIIDSETREKIAVLKKDFTLLVHRWHIESPEGETLAKIESRGKAVGLLRALSDAAQLFPHKYTIENGEGDQIGTIQGKFSFRDKYVIELEESAEDREAIMAAAVTIDALEGN
ncbi:MAG: LURP-one-related/scramblase family protein [Candidatus Nanohalobium sp.]